MFCLDNEDKFHTQYGTVVKSYQIKLYSIICQKWIVRFYKIIVIPLLFISLLSLWKIPYLLVQYKNSATSLSTEYRICDSASFLCCCSQFLLVVARSEKFKMSEAALYIFGLIDGAALLFLTVYFVSFNWSYIIIGTLFWTSLSLKS